MNVLSYTEAVDEVVGNPMVIATETLIESQFKCISCHLIHATVLRCSAGHPTCIDCASLSTRCSNCSGFMSKTPLPSDEALVRFAASHLPLYETRPCLHGCGRLVFCAGYCRHEETCLARTLHLPVARLASCTASHTITSFAALRGIKKYNVVWATLGRNIRVPVEHTDEPVLLATDEFLIIINASKLHCIAAFVTGSVTLICNNKHKAQFGIHKGACDVAIEYTGSVPPIVEEITRAGIRGYVPSSITEQFLASVDITPQHLTSPEDMDHLAAVVGAESAVCVDGVLLCNIPLSTGVLLYSRAHQWAVRYVPCNPEVSADTVGQAFMCVAAWRNKIIRVVFLDGSMLMLGVLAKPGSYATGVMSLSTQTGSLRDRGRLYGIETMAGEERAPSTCVATLAPWLPDVIGTIEYAESAGVPVLGMSKLCGAPLASIDTNTSFVTSRVPGEQLVTRVASKTVWIVPWVATDKYIHQWDAHVPFSVSYSQTTQLQLVCLACHYSTSRAEELIAHLNGPWSKDVFLDKAVMVDIVQDDIYRPVYRLGGAPPLESAITLRSFMQETWHGKTTDYFSLPAHRHAFQQSVADQMKRQSQKRQHQPELRPPISPRDIPSFDADWLRQQLLEIKAKEH